LLILQILPFSDLARDEEISPRETLYSDWCLANPIDDQPETESTCEFPKSFRRRKNPNFSSFSARFLLRVAHGREARRDSEIDGKICTEFHSIEIVQRFIYNPASLGGALLTISIQ
jgi:hypothetical protein